MNAQLARWRALLDAGAGRIGWKIGLNVPAVQERLGLTSPVIGHLTSHSLIEQGEPHSLAGGTRVAIEPEVAIELAADVPPDAEPARIESAIASLAPAIEVVDVDMPFDDLAAILERNVFHRGVAFGARTAVGESGLPEAVEVRIGRNGCEEVAASRPVRAELVAAIRVVAGLLGQFGERLQPGDMIIAGSLTEPTRVAPGDRIAVEIDLLGSLSVSFSP
jgi:2-keto-4-pentenoate hydratase